MALGYDPAQAAEALADFAGVAPLRPRGQRGPPWSTTTRIILRSPPPSRPRPIWASRMCTTLFQPHRYSRAPLFTEVLKDDFGRASTRPAPSRFIRVPGGRSARPRRVGQDVPERGARQRAIRPPRAAPYRVVPYLAGKLGEGDR
ncbi:MAG: hypothetical protein ACLSVD_13495 [Eggerthellaceae bacterium]